MSALVSLLSYHIAALEESESRTLACGLLGKRQRAQHSHPAAQAWRHDIGVNLPENGRCLDVPVEESLHSLPNPWEQMALAHDPATQDDALRRQRADEGHAGQRQIVRFQVPDRVIGGQGLGW